LFERSGTQKNDVGEAQRLRECGGGMRLAQGCVRIRACAWREAEQQCICIDGGRETHSQVAQSFVCCPRDFND
jgi:hypothetical protein